MVHVIEKFSLWNFRCGWIQELCLFSVSSLPLCVAFSCRNLYQQLRLASTTQLHWKICFSFLYSQQQKQNLELLLMNMVWVMCPLLSQSIMWPQEWDGLIGAAPPGPMAIPGSGSGVVSLFQLLTTDTDVEGVILQEKLGYFTPEGERMGRGTKIRWPLCFPGLWWQEVCSWSLWLLSTKAEGIAVLPAGTAQRDTVCEPASPGPATTAAPAPQDCKGPTR